MTSTSSREQSPRAHCKAIVTTMAIAAQIEIGVRLSSRSWRRAYPGHRRILAATTSAAWIGPARASWHLTHRFGAGPRCHPGSSPRRVTGPFAQRSRPATAGESRGVASGRPPPADSHTGAAGGWVSAEPRSQPARTGALHGLPRTWGTQVRFTAFRGEAGSPGVLTESFRGARLMGARGPVGRPDQHHHGHRDRRSSSSSTARPDVVVPKPPSGLLAATRRAWARYWTSDVATVATVADHDLVERLFVLRDEHARALRAVRSTGERLVSGSRQQPRLNPHLRLIFKLEGAIGTPRDRARPVAVGPRPPRHRGGTGHAHRGRAQPHHPRSPAPRGRGRRRGVRGR